MFPTHNHLKARHDSIVKIFAALATEAGLSHRVEDSHTLYTAEGNNIRPDIILLSSIIHGLADAMCDVAVSHPLSQPAKELNTLLQQGCTSKTIKSRKISKYSNAQDRESFKFEPLVFETIGHWDEGVEKLLSLMCKQSSTRNDTPYSTVKFKWSVRLSTALQKGNANAIIAKLDFARGFTLQETSTFQNFIEDSVYQYAVPVC
jgi:hypothetical protein